MMTAARRLACSLSLSLLASTGLAGPPEVDFSRDVRPILSDACFSCHGPDAKVRKANLRLDTQEGTVGPRKGGPVVVAGKSSESELFRRISTAEEHERMPPAKTGRKLTTQQIDVVRRWIDQGAPWGGHWAFATPKRPERPTVTESGWVRNSIDAFVLARLEKEGLKPSPEAGRETLLRRVTLDLTGLPPTPKEVDEFLADSSPNAYEKVVDRLLASPRYGERMVWEWLDAARYADSNGYQSDRTRVMWPWRDWVIDALNRNMPFDQFTVEQVAGDLLPHATRTQKVATGFHRNHMLNGEGGRIPEESRIDYGVDRVDTTATVWLGLTLGCARCHDHKFDPFTQKEYYRLFAYFNSIAESGAVDRGGNAAPVLSLPTPEDDRKIEELTKKRTTAETDLKTLTDSLLTRQTAWEQTVEVTTLPAPAAAALKVSAAERSAQQKKELSDHYLGTRPERQAAVKKVEAAKKAIDDANKAVVQVMVMEDRPSPRETFVLDRGAYDKPTEKVTHGVPAALPPLPKDAPPNRLALAKWLVDPANPLTARVTVNRYWQQFFGTGLVKTTEDFGVQGESPSHPELLDWLATEFVHNGWDVKAMHKLMVTSATYRQSSKSSPVLRERDPDNRLLARGPRHRLPASVLRDQALAVSGLLVEKLGGPPVKPYQPTGVWEEMTFGQIKYQQDKGESLYRRSVYTFWRRTVGPTTMFDTSSRQQCTVRASRTNTPLHALLLLNETTYAEAARKLAERVMRETGAPEDRIATMFRLATARKPTEAERTILTQAMQRLRVQYGENREAARQLVSVGESPRDEKLDVAEHAAYAGLASLVLNLDEVVSKE